MYFLFLLLPYDIIHKIHYHIICDNSLDVFDKFYKHITYKNNALKNIIEIIIHYNILRKINENDCCENIYNNLKIIFYSEFNRIKYNHYFWQCFLHMLSKKLMLHYHTLLVNYNNTRKNNEYKYLKKSIVIWFDMCKKYNIKLALLFNSFNNAVSSDNQFVIIKARNIIAIKNFNKFYASPFILDNNDEFIENYIASNHLSYHLMEII